MSCSLRPNRVAVVLSVLMGLVLAGCSGPMRIPTAAGDGDLTGKDLELGFVERANRNNKDFLEQVTLRGVLEDGGSVYARLRASNFGPRADQDADLLARVTTGGETHQVRVKRKKGQWRWEREALFADLGTGTIRSTPEGTKIHLEDRKGLKIDIEVSNLVVPLRPAGGRAKYPRGGYYLTTVLCPRGELSVTVEVPEEPEPPEPDAPKPEEGEEPEEPPTRSIEAEGIAYIEHRAGNIAPYEVANSWVNVLHVAQEGTFMLSVFTEPAKTGGKVHGWLFHMGEDKQVVYQPEVRIKPENRRLDPKFGYRVPQIVHIAGPDGLKGVVKVAKLINVKEEMGNLSKLEQMIVKKLTWPVTFTHEGRYLVTVPDPDPNGAEPRKISGKTRYVYMQLNP